MVRSLLVALILESLLAPRLGAQTEQSPISLDLIVRDKKNVPVADLRAEEVEVYEGGVKQTFEGFRRVGMAAPSGPGAAPPASGPEATPLVVLLFPRLSAAERELARGAAEEFLKKQLAPGVSVAVLLVGPELVPIQGFTQDAAVLKDAIRRALDPSAKAGDPDVQALYSLVQWLKGQPGRKAALLFSSGLGVPPGFEGSVEELQGLANRYRISFYGVDPRGIEMERKGIAAADQQSEGLASELWNLGGASRTGEEIRNYRSSGPSFQGSSPEALGRLAQGTGGLVLERTNNFSKGMRQIGEDVAGYYELTYAPTTAKAAGEYRNIEIKVARDGAKVQTRQPYLVGDAGAALVPAFEKRLAGALQADRADDAVEVWSRALHYGWDGKQQTQVLWLSLPLAKVSLAVTPPPGRFEGAVSILSRVKDASGKVVATYSQHVPLLGPADQLGRARGQSVPFVRQVKLGPGDYTLETAVQDERADKLTVRRTPLKVQAPSGLALSSLSLGELLPAGPGSDPDDPLRLGNQRLIPNLGQPIKAGQATMTLHSVVYTPTGSKEAANMTITLSLENQAVNRASAVLPAPDAGGRIPYATALKMDVLPVGRYRFDVAVTQGASRAEESLAFTIAP